MGRMKWPAMLLTVLLLTGCSGGESPGSEMPEEKAVPAADMAAGYGQEADLEAAQVESSARALTEEEILDAYQRAEVACGWFALQPLPDSGEIVQIDGVDYREVDVPGIQKMEDLRTYLRSLFSGELTEQLLATGGSCPLYREIDGSLYVCASGRSRNSGKGNMQIQINRIDETSYTVDVTMDLLGAGGETMGVECWSFHYAYVDGRWVFTDFRLVW